ncbi:MAG: putative protein N(5)-glutamine methyltransferase [Herbiconiux sp.]|nr:putative protein N(5)-glutamine methyltransferase [Herbiconiux sp.]
MTEVGGDVVRRLRAAGCVFAEEEAALLREAAEAAAAGAGVVASASRSSEAPATGGFAAELERMVAARVAGLPLEQVVGWAEFDGMRILMSPGVFVPRRRTELLVREAVAGLGTDRHAVVVDLCCGSGAVGAAIARRLGVDADPDADPAEVYAADLDPAAVACARRNLRGDRVFEGDLYAALPIRLRGRIDVLAVNAPYVPTDAIGTMPPEAREHEATMALDGGADGLDLQRRVIEGAREWLASGGRLLIETSEHQVELTRALFERAGFETTVHRDDDLDGTVVSGVLTAP